LISRFLECANNINRAWDAVQWNGAAFSDIAAEELQQSRLLQEADPNDVIHWLMQSEGVPPQDTYEFGQPPIIVYSDSRFYIQVLFWLDGTTSIHQHAFCGAFGVLSGSSLHSGYNFKPFHDDSAPLLLGTLKFRGAELLGRGDVRPIYAGDNIHALFHLDRPSVSIVIRTPGSDRILRQFNYLHPGLAIDPRHKPALETIQLRMLESLAKTELDRFWSMAELAIRNVDVWMLYKILSIAFKKASDTGKWERILELARQRAGDFVDPIVESLHAKSAEARIIGLRETVHDPTHRFLLALLLNVPSRDLVFKFISERFPLSDPESLLLRWLGEIFREPRSGIKLPPLALHLLRIAMHNPDYESSKHLLDRFLSSPEAEHKVRDTWEKLLALNLFKPLFQSDGVYSAVAQ
jgi:hypothetical protein